MPFGGLQQQPIVLLFSATYKFGMGLAGRFFCVCGLLLGQVEKTSARITHLCPTWSAILQLVHLEVTGFQENDWKYPRPLEG